MGNLNHTTLGDLLDQTWKLLCRILIKRGTPWKFNSSPLKIHQDPEGKYSLSFFKWRSLNFTCVCVLRLLNLPGFWVETDPISLRTSTSPIVCPFFAPKTATKPTFLRWTRSLFDIEWWVVFSLGFLAALANKHFVYVHICSMRYV